MQVFGRKVCKSARQTGVRSRTRGLFTDQLSNGSYIMQLILFLLFVAQFDRVRCKNWIVVQ